MLNQPTSSGSSVMSAALSGAVNNSLHLIKRAWRSTGHRLSFNYVSAPKDPESVVMGVVNRGGPFGIPAPKERSMTDTPMNRIIGAMRRQASAFRQRGADYRIH